MRQFRAAALIVCGLVASLPGVIEAASTAGPWRPIGEISGAASVQVIVSGNSRQYSRLRPGAPASITMAGPARIRIISRAELPAKTAGTIAYRLRVTDQMRIMKEHATESSPAPDAHVKKSNKVIYKSRSTVVEVPKGDHKLELSCEGTPSLLVRILIADSIGEREAMSSITPIEATRSVTLSEGERLIPYYTVTADHAVRLRVIGPTRLEVSTRLDFDPTMRGVQLYTIGITKAGQSLRETRLRTTKATAGSYTDLKDRVPSKADRIVLELGPGIQELSIELVEPHGGSAEIHARIPQPKIGSNE